MDNKELISEDKLLSLMNKCIREKAGRLGLGGVWEISPTEGVGLCWNVYCSVGSPHHVCGARLCGNRWNIYNNSYKKRNVNIKIYKDNIEFDEDSKFKDFDKGFMYSLYELLNERIFGIKEEEKCNEQ